MRGKNTIYINGRQYDAVTGLAISIDAPAEKSYLAPAETHADTVAAALARSASIKRAPAAHHKHHKVTKSSTLRRDLVKKPLLAPTSPAARIRPAVSKSPAISRFASHPVAMKQQVSLSKAKLHPSAAHKNHTLNRVQSTVASAALSKVVTPKKALSSRELKEQIIASKLAEIEPSKVSHLKKQSRSYPRLASVMTAGLAVVVLGGYLTYINMPNLSMRVAASQAGVNAKFPDYHPAGYTFDGPIAYSGGEVAVKFQATGNDKGYTIRQKNSNWDSQAVLDNYVAKQSSQYLTSSEQGLTIYTYQNKAAWVNGGVLYTIEGSAPLSNEQVLRIAGSM